MSEQKDIDSVPGEATPSPDHTEANPGGGPAVAVPEQSPPEETGPGD